MYLQGKIKFYDINRAIEYVLEKIDKINNVDIQVLNQTDALARQMVCDLFGDKL
jgi:1-deoxy-D-xylulose 5-phosphate reductoisomerase